MGVSILDWKSIDDDTQRRLASWAQTSPPYHGLVATDHCTPVGVLLLSPSDERTTLDAVFVAANERSKGIGTALLQRAIRRVAGPLYVCCGARHVRWFLRNGFTYDSKPTSRTEIHLVRDEYM